MLVGPEGGFSEAERGLLAGVPAMSVSDHVLSADTAPIAIAAVLLQRQATTP